MNARQIQKFVMRYLQATDCHIIEKSAAHVTVRLSPAADKDLTNRPYYWGFVERTGAPPETLTFTFVFEPGAQPSSPAPAQPSAQPVAAEGSGILARYFGFAPTPAGVRAQRDDMTFGSRRLQQLFGVVKQRGRIVQLFEESKSHPDGRFASLPYTTWFGVNFKVSFICDMKRDELHSLGISLSGGEWTESFHDKMMAKKLTPKIPANRHITRGKLTLPKAMERLEAVVDKKIRLQDDRWAVEAESRLEEELSRIRGYYDELIASLQDEEKRKEAQDQYANRLREAEWQHGPRVEVTIVNCGLFHLLEL